MWNFEYLWQAEPGSGDLPLDSGFWNRCDFTDSNIELNYTGDFTPSVSNSETDCNELEIFSNGHCNSCIDNFGPEEFLVTVSLSEVTNENTLELDGYFRDTSPCGCTHWDREGSFILGRVKSKCRDEITVRNGFDCPCSPCSSGVVPKSSCGWSINSSCGIWDTSIVWTRGSSSGICPCNPGPCDAAQCANSDLQIQCGGCCCSEWLAPGVLLGMVMISGQNYLKVSTNSTSNYAVLSSTMNIDTGPCTYLSDKVDCLQPIHVTIDVDNSEYKGTIEIESL
jgi:hypothetical protein